MPPKSLKAIACSVLKPELSALRERGLIPFPVRFLDSCLHMRPEALHARLQEIVESERDAGFRILLIYGDCSAYMTDLAAGGDVFRITAANCGEMLLGKARHKSLIKKGAFLLFPEWVERWIEILSHFPGMDVETTKAMMRDMHSRFVYLNTGVRPVPHKALQACGEFFSLPCVVVDIGLDHLQGLLGEAMNRTGGPEQAAAPPSFPGWNATAVMMLDIITAVLKHPENIPETISQLSQKLRELTGARMVILAVIDLLDDEKAGHRILTVNPPRHTALSETGPVRELIEEAFALDQATVLPLRAETGDAESPPAGMELRPCLIIPLKSGEERIGAILSLGLLDASYADSILEIQETLSSMVSVVLKNALLVVRQQRIRQAMEREIAERRQAEETLKRSEEQVRLLLNSTAEAIYGIDLQGNCTFANPSCLRTLGYAEAGQLLGQNMHRLIHHSRRDGTPVAMEECSIYRAFREGTGVHRDDEVLWKADGTCFPVEYWSYPQVLDGAVSGAVVTFIDITERKRTEEALKESRQQFQGLVETLYDWVWEVDSRGRYTYVSPQVTKILGYEPQEILGKTPFDLMSPEEAKQVSKKFAAVIKELKPIIAMENINIHKDGHPVVMETNGLPFFDADGNFQGYRGTDRDITNRKQAAEMLAAERQRLAAILEGTNVGTWEWNVQTGETVFNERWAEIIGYTLGELAPLSIDTWTKFVHPDDLPVSGDLLERHFRKELPYYECEARMRHQDGSWVWVLDRGKVVTWADDGKPLVMAGTHQDITARKLAEEKIRHMATHDGLTDLPSLSLAKDRLSMALGIARRQKNLAAVMFIDLDGFKAVNDTLGHDTGDYVLKQVAQRLRSCVRETDTVARVGGDEFLLIATALHSPDDAARIAEKAIHLVSQPIIVNGRQAIVGASIGIALYPDRGEDMDQLIKQADEAMYRIKNTGKNGFCFADPAIK